MVDDGVPKMRRLSGPDRVLAGIVVMLIACTALVRPVWAAVDPAPANALSALASLRAGEPLDPWGQPWLYSPTFVPSLFAPAPAPVPTPTPDPAHKELRVHSAGPDGIAGSSDDLDVWFVHRDANGVQSFMQSGWPESLEPESRGRLWSYRSAPAVPLVLAAIVVFARWLSGRVWAARRLRHRAALAALLALLPAVLAHLVLLVNGAIVDVIEASPIKVAAPFYAMLGSIYLVFVCAIFAHRELSTPPPE